MQTKSRAKMKQICFAIKKTSELHDIIMPSYFVAGGLFFIIHLPPHLHLHSLITNLTSRQDRHSHQIFFERGQIL